MARVFFFVTHCLRFLCHLFSFSIVNYLTSLCICFAYLTDVIPYLDYQVNTVMPVVIDRIRLPARSRRR